MSTEVARQESAVGMRKAWPVAGLAFLIAVFCQVIGSLTLDLGIGKIVIFPMVWGIIIGALVSIQKLKPLGLDLQKTANALVGVAVLLLVARLAFNIGPSLRPPQVGLSILLRFMPRRVGRSVGGGLRGWSLV